MSTKQEYRIFGLRRSGNHMIIAAIISCFDKQEVHYYNDVVNPTNLVGQLSRSYHNKSVDKLMELSDRLVDKSAYNVNIIKNSHKRCLIHTYEDKNLDIINSINKQNFNSVKIYNILILRDPYNWLASRIQHYKKNVGCTVVNEKILNLWKNYAREFLSETNTLGIGKIVINYNKFIIDEHYRREIATKLNLDANKMKIDAVLGFGKGSSFTDLKKVENKNSYNERWKLFQNNVVFKNWINDKELRELSNKIFGNIYQ
jgi:hypothetical protein